MKNKLAIGLIIFFLLIVGFYSFFGEESKDEIAIEAEIADVSSITHPELDLEATIFRIEYEDNYYFNKKLNYYLMSFFENINSNTIDMEIMNKEYVEFMQLTEEDLIFPYISMKNIDYDIVSYRKIKDSYIVNLNYRETGTDKRLSRSFSLFGDTLSDRSFFYIESMESRVENRDFQLEIVEKGVFDGYEIYKINIENISEELLLIDDSMYGFNAIKENNKYYHSLENKGKFYDVVPGEVGKFLVKFDCLDPEGIYVTINEKEFKIY